MKWALEKELTTDDFVIWEVTSAWIWGQTKVCSSCLHLFLKKKKKLCLHFTETPFWESLLLYLVRSLESLWKVSPYIFFSPTLLLERSKMIPLHSTFCPAPGRSSFYWNLTHYNFSLKIKPVSGYLSKCKLLSANFEGVWGKWRVIHK